MAGRFGYFVVLAGMRTGSNLLEEYLSAMPGVRSHGELFNPHFFGKPKSKEQFGLSIEDRDADPVRVIDAMRNEPGGLQGFRLFYDHDPRVIEHVLADERAAKIVLSRRPVDSYVSLKIARKTGQWWLGDLSSARGGKVAFDADEYADFVNTLTDYQQRIRRVLQSTGQTAFFLDYSDLSEEAVIGGLGRYLGAEGPPDAGEVRAKVQNPQPVAERLVNADEAEARLRELAAPDIGLIPSYEPERGPGLRMFHVCRTAPLLYMPIRGAGSDPVPDWLQKVDAKGKVEKGLTQKDVRRWMRKHPGHRTFTVLRHPLPRAYDAFCRFVLPTDQQGHADIRSALSERYSVPLPREWPCEGWTLVRQREAFLEFLKFLAGNLGGQTSLRVDYSWASQAALLEAVAGFKVPDRVVREDTAGIELAQLAALAGCPEAPVFDGAFGTDSEFPLSSVRTAEIEAACANAYRRDYVFFGFDAWTPVQAA